MNGQARSDEELRELLSALLDGELTDHDAAEVRALLDRADDARAELEALTVVRAAVRDLPPVDPPFGFYERLLLRGGPGSEAEASAAAPRVRSARRSWARSRAIAAVAAAAAAIVLIVGITPATDSIVPPVQAFAARHSQMATPPPGAGPGPAAPTPATTVASTSPITEPMAFDPMAVTDLDAMDAPYVAPVAIGGGSMPRVAGYHSDDGVLHVMYGSGPTMVSVYEQAGTVEWERMPAGTAMTIGGDAAWVSTTGAVEVVVVARGRIVYTVVASTPHETTMAVVTDLPRPPDESVVDRARTACASVVDQFGFGRDGT